MADTLDIYESIQQDEEKSEPKGTLQIYEAITSEDPVKTQAKMNFNLAAEKSPEAEAKVAELAEKTGRPAPLVRDALEDTEKVAAEPDWENLDPGVVQYLAESESNAAQSHDDIEGLGAVAKMVRYWKDLGKDTITSWKSGSQNIELGNLYYQKIILRDDSVDEAIKNLEAIQVRPPEGQDWFGLGITAAAAQIPFMADVVAGGIERGLEAAIIGGTGALLYGQAGPQALLLEEFITVPATALAFGGEGFIAGSGERVFKIESGLMGQELLGIEDSQGHKLHPEAVRMASIVGGLLIASTELGSLGLFANLVPGSTAVKRVFFRSAIIKALKNETVAASLAAIGKKYVIAVGGEISQELIQEGINILGAEILKSTDIHPNTFEAVTLEEVLAREMEIAKKTAAAVITLGLPLVSIQAATSVRDIKRASEYKESQLQINEKVNESKTKERSPELMEKFLDTAGFGEDVFIKGDLAEEFFQQNPDIAEKIGLDAETAAQAAAEGQDVKLKISTLHARLEAEEFAQVADIIKPGPAALSEREASLIDEEAELDQLVELYQAQQEDEAVFQSDLQRLRGEALTAGRSQEEVDSWLQIVESFARRHADEGGELTSLTQKLTGVVAEDFVPGEVFVDEDGAVYDQTGQLITENEAFQRWFGESAVIDEGGQPLTVYHGTNAAKDFETFFPWSHFGTIEHAGFRLGALAEDIGSLPRVIPAYLSIKNPLSMNDLGDWDSAGEVLAELERVMQVPEKIHQAVINEIEYEGLFDTKAETRGLIVISNFLINEGYDGIVYENLGEGPGLSYIAFKPEQIKSVFNRGTFDPTSAKILEQRPQMKLGRLSDKASEKEYVKEKFEDNTGLPGITSEKEYEGRTGDKSHITRTEFGFLNTKDAMNLEGVMGEKRGFHTAPDGTELFGNYTLKRWEELKADIAENGFNDPIFIIVDPGEKAKVSEGNHRIHAASQLGIETVPVEVRYFGNAQNETRVLPTESQTAINASGESAASLEALAVEASRKAKGIKHIIIDTRSGETRPAIGPRPEDNALNPTDILVQVEGEKAQVVNVGSAVREKVDWISRFKDQELFQQPAGFFSALKQAVENIETKAMPAKDWMNRIRKIPGVKPDEIKWTGLEEWLELRMEEGGQGKVSREDILNYLDQNGVQIEEIKLFESDEIYPPTEFDEEAAQLWEELQAEFSVDTGVWPVADPRVQRYRMLSGQITNLIDELRRPTKFGEYVLPGGQDYTELLLTIPGLEGGANIAEFDRFKELQQMSDDTMTALEKTEFEILDRKVDRLIKAGQFSSGHWDETNVLAHVRFNTRVDSKGKKSLFIEELQSDWAFELRKSKDKEQLTATVQPSLDPVWDWEIVNQMGQVIETFSGPREQADSIARSLEKKYAGAPEAPFVTSNAWQGLVLKRMLRYAAENGFDSVSWISGEQTAERYSLDTKIEKIVYTTRRDGRYSITVYDTPGGVPILNDKIPEFVTESELENIVGKEIAQRIAAGQGTTHSSFAGAKILKGDDLKVQAAWARNLYDKAVPSFMKKFGKKYDAQVGNISVPTQLTDENMKIYKTRDARGPEASFAVYDNEGLHLETFPTEEKAKAFINKIQESMTQQSLPITDEMRMDIIRQGLPLFQNISDPQGSLVVADGKYLIKLFETANKSTLIHETAHIFLQEIKSLVQSGNASEAITQDWGKVQEWLNVSLEEGITRKQHEQFAEAFEAYLFEGKAPSTELASAFERFRTWLVEIYKTTKRLNVTVNNEIRGVFDRLLATEEQIDLYSEEIGLTVRTPSEMDALGLKEEDRAFLKRLVQGAKDKAKIQYQKAKDRGRKKLVEQWTNEARKEVSEMPIYKLRNDLAQKGQGLDIDLMREDYGDGVVQQINAKRLGMVQEGGVNPAEIAEKYEYSTVRDMLDAILNSQTQNEAIADLVAIKQQGHEGQFTPDGPVLENEGLENYMEAMGRYIGKALGREERISVQSMKRFAERNLAVMPLKEALRIDRFLSAMQRAMKQEREAISKGDFEGALQANRQARLNYQYARQVKKLQQRVDAFERRSKRIARNKGTISINYLENLKEILRRYSVVDTAPVDPAKMPGLETLLVKEEYFEDAPAFSDWLMARQDEISFKNLEVDEFFELFDFVKYLEKKGRDEAKGAKSILTSLEISLEEALQQTVKPMEGLKGKKKIKQANRLKKIKSWAREYAAGNKMLLFLMRAADGFSNTGKKGVAGANETLIYGNLVNADNTQTALRNEYQEVLSEILAHFQPKIGNREFPSNLDLGVPVPANLAEEGLEWTFERVLAIAFNMGTEYNKNALMEGYNLDEAQLQKILSVLDSSDWIQIQKMWDMVNSYWGRLSEVYERRHGIRPPKVKATPFTTAEGQQMQGGYYPIRFDPAIDPKTQEREEVDILKHSANAAFAPAPASGMLKKRRGSGGKPVNLSLSVLTQHLDYVTKYIAFAEAIRDVDRITSSKEYRREFRRVMGEEYYKGETSIKRLLKDLVGVDRERMGAFDKAVNKGRNMATRYILGVNPSIALKQAYSLPGFVMDVGINVYRKGLMHTVTNPGRAYQNMLDLSSAMKDRVKRIDRDTMSALRSDTKRATYTRDVINFFLIHLVDGITVVPAWHGAYIQSMEDTGGDRAAAVIYADKTIAASQPFNRTIDMAYHQRSQKGAHVLFTMFSSFTMKFGNRSWYFTQGFKQGKIDWPTYLKHIALERVLPPVLMSVMFSSLWGEEPEWEDVGLDVLTYQIIGMPFFRDLAVAAAASYRVAKGRGFKRDVSSPVFTAVELAQRAVAAGFQWSLDMEDPDKAERAQWALFEILSFVTGVPASRIGSRIKRGMEQIADGEGGIGAMIGIPEPNVRKK